MDAWAARHPVDEELAERLIREQFPELDGDVVEVGVGWDHRVWRCGGVAFRFPQQDEALSVGRDRREALARLAPRLPLAVPEPLLLGEPSEAYPGWFVGYRWLPGDLPARLDLTRADRVRAAPALAGFARAVHAVPLETAEAWGLEIEGKRGSMAERVGAGRRRAEQLAGTGFAELARRAAEAMASAPAECRPEERRVVHGDLHAGQVLFDAEHTLVGVIDWDSLAIGDPAFDLLMAWSFVPAEGRAAFWDAYGESTAKARARHLALSYGLGLLAQGVATGDEGVRDEAAYSLECALEGC